MNRIQIILAGGAFFLLLLAACQPQIVEVEVTRIVTETETVVEEQVVEEVIGAEPQIGAEAVSDDLQASGSEEDGGSPFGPPAGLTAKIVPTRMATAGWIDMESVSENEVMMRLIAENQQNIVVIHQLTSRFGRSTLLITGDQLYFVQALHSLPAVPARERQTPEILAAAIAEIEPTEALAEQSVLRRCTLCAAGGTAETIVLMWPRSGLTITIDQNAQVDELNQLLDLLRQEHHSHSQEAALRAFRLGEYENR